MSQSSSRDQEHPLPQGAEKLSAALGTQPSITVAQPSLPSSSQPPVSLPPSEATTSTITSSSSDMHSNTTTAQQDCLTHIKDVTVDLTEVRF